MKTIRLIPTLTIGLIILAYICVKAFTASFTHDESFSYLHYIDDSFMAIISYSNYYTNNHILNSLLMKYSEQLFGTSEFALRLPNLILFGMYMIYSYLLFRKENPFVATSVFILLCTCGQLTDLFGLARGYGLSCGFMLMGLYHFIAYFRDHRKFNMILFHVGALLATLSNFTLLDFYAVMLLISNLLPAIESAIYTDKKYSLIAVNKIHVIPLLISAAVSYEPIRRLFKGNNLNFGGQSNFYDDTVKSLVNYTTRFTEISAETLLLFQILVTATVIIPLFMILRKIVKKDRKFYLKNKSLIIVNLLIIFLAAAVILQHALFKTDYPIDRFSAFLYPLFIINAGLFADTMINQKSRIIITASSVFLALASVTNFVANANLSRSSEWIYDSETKNVITEISRQRRLEPRKDVTVEINWLFEPTFNFYRKIWHLHWLKPLNRDGITGKGDYYYVFRDELDKLDPNDYLINYEFTEINTVLAKNLRD